MSSVEDLEAENKRQRGMLDWFETFFYKLSSNGIPPVGYGLDKAQFRLQVKRRTGRWETWNGDD